MADETNAPNPLELATELTIAWLSNPNTRAPAEEVPAFLQRMHDAVTTLSSGPAQGDEPAAEPQFTPAVTARKSLASKDHIISMIDGKPYKSLKRHLSGHGLTPDQYRERYGLKSDYPMVAENYAQVRRDLAKKIGLGRKPKHPEATPPVQKDPEPKTAKPRGRRKARSEDAPAAEG
jgi:predicted transcriptional regulator